jgi:hypothetical protein
VCVRRRRSLTDGQTKDCLTTNVIRHVVRHFSHFFVPSRSFSGTYKSTQNALASLASNNKGAPRNIQSFLLQQSTKPRFHVDSPTRLSFLRLSESLAPLVLVWYC